MALNTTSALVPQIDLQGLIKGRAPSNFTVSKLIVSAPKYLKDLGPVLESTPNDVLLSFFIWKVIMSYESYIEADETRPYRQFTNELAGRVHIARNQTHEYILTNSRTPMLNPIDGDTA